MIPLAPEVINENTPLMICSTANITPNIHAHFLPFRKPQARIKATFD